MSNIKNMQQLRERVLQAFDDLEDGSIDIAHASCIAKMSETVISGLKSEMQYAVLTGCEPAIPFYNQQNLKALDVEKIKTITSNSVKTKLK